jgi:hypothetical protein
MQPSKANSLKETYAINAALQALKIASAKKVHELKKAFKIS